jgi:hypothetical protein
MFGAICSITSRMIVLYKILVVLVPTYTIAYLTDKMVYVIPMLAACTLIASTSFNRDKRSRRLDEDDYDDADG